MQESLTPLHEGCSTERERPRRDARPPTRFGYDDQFNMRNVCLNFRNMKDESERRVNGDYLKNQGPSTNIENRWTPRYQMFGPNDASTTKRR